ncbi:membrane protein [Actinomycetospora sp. NBRC 106375]|uniref:hypothetical protein n=1 Tax=Actinomycetospora sp. NBRC 106375 TaxID=3032207 RepID=UPI0024A30440|nr:hypothetical protein [Actinomycetospora sp. NBRC 106375]GLZ48249.1 membrane protein [Actinomycetospora sp. NBRC 106375]
MSSSPTAHRRRIGPAADAAEADAAVPGAVAVLRRLFLARSGFALVWAVLLFLTAGSITPLAAVLLVLYPLVDVAAAVIDRRVQGTGGAPATSRVGLLVTVAVSALAAVGLAVAVTAGVPAVLRVWGAWAIVAGVVQLVVAVSRRGLGGQWPMIASGALSTVAGTAFLLQSFAAGAALAGVAGYALLGGAFFLVSAWRLGRASGR